MLIRCGYRIVFETEAPVPMIALLHVRPERQEDLRTEETLHTDPKIPTRQFVDRFGNVATRMVLPAGTTTLSADFIVADSGDHDDYAPEAERHDIDSLPDDALPYLMGSRYCEVGKLADEAWAAAGDKPTGWAMVQALVDLAHEQIEFGYSHARSDRTAFDAFGERHGVCRDFAHLAITLCREVNIPARYCTGYLGDLGIEPIDAPMDFSAWFEAFIGGKWYAFDARHNAPRIGRVVMARGRDATDTALTTGFGASELREFHVHCDEVAGMELDKPPSETAVPQTYRPATFAKG